MDLLCAQFFRIFATSSAHGGYAQPRIGVIASKLPSLPNVQILRGIAAMLVVMYHVPDDLVERGWKDPFPITYAGAAGVDLFFVISGFIMVYSTVDLFQKPGASVDFLLRRCARVVPLYWIFTTLYVIDTIRVFRHTHPLNYSVPHFVASYFFIFYLRPGYDDFPIYRPGWTLNYEMFFYIGFAAVLLFPRPKALVALSVFLAGLVGIAVATQWRPVTLPWTLGEWANTDLLEFIFGMVLAQIYLKGFRISRPVAVVSAALALMALTITSFYIDAWFPYRGFVWGPLAAIVVAAAVLCPPCAEGRVRLFFRSLGDASYSLYLVHSAFFLLLAYSLGRIVDLHRIPAAYYGAIMFFGAIALAFVVHRRVERPMTRALQRQLSRRMPSMEARVRDDPAGRSERPHGAMSTWNGAVQPVNEPCDR